MTTVALFGAGGKMGYRLASNFRGSPYDVRHVEVSEAGRRAAEGPGWASTASASTRRWTAPRWWCWRCRTPTSARSPPASRSKLEPGTMVVVLDAAAPYRRPSAGAPGPHLFRHPSLPSADLQRRDGDGGQEGLFRRHRGQAAHRQRADAGAGGGLRQGRGDRQDRSGRR